MIDGRTLRQTGVIVLLALVGGSLSNLSAGKERKLKWVADWSGVPSAALSPAPSAEPDPVPSGGPYGVQPGVSASPAAATTTAVDPGPSAQPSGTAAANDPKDPALPLFEIKLAAALAAHGSGALFLDARRSEEFAEGHIPGARSFAVWESDVDDKIVALMSEVPFSTQLVCYCNGGKCEDSHTLRNKLLAAGYRDVLVFHDGFPEWRDRGHEVEK